MQMIKSNYQWFMALAVVLVMPLFIESGSLASEVLIYALAVLGCNLLLGFTGLLSFGQGIFFGMGSYTLGILLVRLDWPLAVTLPLTVLAGVLSAIFVGSLAIRQRNVYFALLTLAMAQMFYFLAYTMTGLTGGDNGLLDVPRPALSLLGTELMSLETPWQFYCFVALCFLTVFWLLQRITTSVFGRTLLAIRDNEPRASAVGYDVQRLKLAVFAISGGVTALAGGLLAMMAGIAPLSSIEYHTSEMILVMTIIGGTSSLFASLLGAGFYIIAADWLSFIWPRWLMLLGVLLMLISLYMQRGLWGIGETLWHLMRRRRTPPAKATPTEPQP
ncbi:MAG: branched-chain amino acid ABC transporter permease [Candidimonas sp.]|nr:branched-chain amino acid ABC transporter permease [Candidimonas sp.]